MPVKNTSLCQHTYHTPLGDMLAIADETYLYMLEFIDRKNIKTNIERLLKENKATLTESKTSIHAQLEPELKAYFDGRFTSFKIPIKPQGTLFQKEVWAALQNIKHGSTQSYTELAQGINKPSASRAVAGANSNNTLAIIIPCHRVIKAEGTLSGYAAGTWRKDWLIKHECPAKAWVGLARKL